MLQHKEVEFRPEKQIFIFIRNFYSIFFELGCRPSSSLGIRGPNRDAIFAHANFSCGPPLADISCTPGCQKASSVFVCVCVQRKARRGKGNWGVVFARLFGGGTKSDMTVTTPPPQVGQTARRPRETSGKCSFFPATLSPGFCFKTWGWG